MKRIDITDINRAWDDDAIPVLRQYIEIPARSPMFDPDWESAGHIDAVAELFLAWVQRRELTGLSVELVRLAGLTPVLVAELPATRSELANSTVVLYGHMDKQPEMLPWSEGLGPWTPVLRGERLYGRGGGDDGYAMFAAIFALEALQRAGGDHGRVVVLIEASEESSSTHLGAYLDHLQQRIGRPDLVVCLDSFCETYDRVWLTTGLRGVAGGVLEIVVAEDSPHSGRASGILPSAVRILRQLLDRIEDSTSGAILIESANVEIPDERVREAVIAAGVFPSLASSFHPVPGLQPMSDDPAEQLLHGTWRPALEVIGIDHLPSVDNGGNVFRSRLRVKLSLRVPPTSDVESVVAEMIDRLATDPPYGAQVRFVPGASGPGWNAPPFASWLTDAVSEASVTYFGNPSASCGVGGTIPFMGMLVQRFPDAQFLVVGVLGPESNAHGPDEFLHVPTAKRLTACVAEVLNAHARSLL